MSYYKYIGPTQEKLQGKRLRLKKNLARHPLQPSRLNSLLTRMLQMSGRRAARRDPGTKRHSPRMWLPQKVRPDREACMPAAAGNLGDALTATGTSPCIDLPWP